MTGDRALSDVFQDILGNLQEIVRAEVRLAKTEVRQEVVKTASSSLWLLSGMVLAINACLFVFWTAAYGLATVLPMWEATLIVAAALTILAIVLTMVGMRRIRRVHPIPERTVETLKENLEWAKRSVK